MGLEISHGAWQGAYSAFNRLRQAICKAAGGHFPPHPKGATLPNGEPMLPDYYYLDDEYEAAHPGLSAFLRSNDCGGVEFPPEVAAKIADDLELLLPALSEAGKDNEYLERRGGYHGATKRYIEGRREAAAKGEPLVYW